jgi:hypothetical protein
MLCIVFAILQVGMFAHSSSLKFYRSKEKQTSIKSEMSQCRWSANGIGEPLEFLF